jgi:hypothetical protein
LEKRFQVFEEDELHYTCPTKVCDKGVVDHMPLFDALKFFFKTPSILEIDIHEKPSDRRFSNCSFGIKSFDLPCPCRSTPSLGMFNTLHLLQTLGNDFPIEI